MSIIMTRFGKIGKKMGPATKTTVTQVRSKIASNLAMIILKWKLETHWFWKYHFHKNWIKSDQLTVLFVVCQILGYCSYRVETWILFKPCHDYTFLKARVMLIFEVHVLRGFRLVLVMVVSVKSEISDFSKFSKFREPSHDYTHSNRLDALIPNITLDFVWNSIGSLNNFLFSPKKQVVNAHGGVRALVETVEREKRKRREVVHAFNIPNPPSPILLIIPSKRVSGNTRHPLSSWWLFLNSNYY